MRNTRKNRYALHLLLALCIAGILLAVSLSNASTVHAASTKIISSTSSRIVCGNTATIKNMSGNSYQYSSSNKKVATVSSSGEIKAIRLGETRITVKKGTRVKNFYLTVVPQKKSDLRLNHQIVLPKQKFELKVVSDKYDTSQINAKFNSVFGEIKKDGKCNGINYDCLGTVGFSYGLFRKSDDIRIMKPSRIYDEMISNIYAGEQWSAKYMISKDKYLYPSDFLKNGIRIKLNGRQMSDTDFFSPGEYKVVISAGNITYKRTINLICSISAALKYRDSSGFPANQKKVFDVMFSALDSIIKDGMTDEEKVRAIHDYLIHHADYYNNGDYSNAPGWAYAAKGVLINKEGVCQSYAIAFNLMALSAGLDCNMVQGTATNSVGQTGEHAWNRVLVDNEWYYIDCTWDDPVGGGHERYDYYLSKKLWNNHRAKKEYTLFNKYCLDPSYITG